MNAPDIRRPPHRGSLAAGSTFGRYEILSHIATGGMADVWLARARGVSGFAKLVALKTLLPSFAARAEFVDMLVREASVAAKLSHPGIVQIFDLGLINDLHFIEMEYVCGHTLRQAMQQARRRGLALSHRAVLRVVAECCDALAYAHELQDDNGCPLNLVHRDVSPENVMVSSLGHPKLLDFGIVASGLSSTTSVGRLKGKYAYMAPETFRGASPHKSRDLYAVGVMLYELLTARRPFEAKSDPELMYRIAHDCPLPLRAHDPSISADLDALVMNALEPKPEARPASAALLSSSLRAVLGQASGSEDVAGHFAEIFTASSPPPNAKDTIADSPQEISALEIDISTDDIADAAQALSALIEDQSRPSLDPSAPSPLIPAPRALSWAKNRSAAELMPRTVTVGGSNVQRTSTLRARTQRTRDVLLAAARSTSASFDTGDLFPSVRSRSAEPGFDLFDAYRRKK